MKPDLASQASALRHIHSIAQRSEECPERVLEWAAAGIRTLDWMAARPELVKAMAVLFETFPGAEFNVNTVE